MADSDSRSESTREWFKTTSRSFITNLAPVLPMLVMALPLLLVLLASIYYIYWASIGNPDGIANIDYVRGIITLFFAVGTIAIACILTFAAVFLPSGELKERLNSGKEILGVLIGIFGTIVGFYFGSASSGGSSIASRPVIKSISPEEIPQNTDTELELKGTGFTKASVILFEDEILQPIERTNSKIRVNIQKQKTSIISEKFVRVVDPENGVLSGKMRVSIVNPPRK